MREASWLPRYHCVGRRGERSEASSAADSGGVGHAAVRCAVELPRLPLCSLIYSHETAIGRKKTIITPVTGGMGDYEKVIHNAEKLKIRKSLIIFESLRISNEQSHKLKSIAAVVVQYQFGIVLTYGSK